MSTPTNWLSDLTHHRWPVIGMVHLRPLPGSPSEDGALDATLAAAEADARALTAGGVAALMVENYGDTPFHPGAVPPVTVAAMTLAVAAVRCASSLPVGVNVLRNDALAALAVAHVTGADFIRVNVLTGAMVTDQGVIQGLAHDLLRLRRALGAVRVRILADVLVKHAQPLVPMLPGRVAADTVTRGGADGLLVSGEGTGAAPDLAVLEAARAATPFGIPLLLGSGLTAENAATFVPLADGAVVGTSLKHGGRVTAPVDVARVRGLVTAVAG